MARRGFQARNIAKVAAARRLLTWVFYAICDGDKALRARRLARHPPCHPRPNGCSARGLTYAHRFSRHS